MNVKQAVLGAILIVVGIVAWLSMYIVHETEQTLVIRFGEPVRVVQEPGLALKWPWETIVRYDDRVLSLDPPVEQVILADQRRLDVDSFARFRIVDPLVFYRTVRTEETGRERLARSVNAALRRVLGSTTQLEVLSGSRGDIMAEIARQVNADALSFGIDIVDVRIGRADLPAATEQAVYDRMRSERQREAAEFRAQGQEQAQQIRARADRERTVILAEAERDAQILRGEGDAQAIRILAEAYGSNPEFFAFYRTLQAYRQSMQPEDTTMVLSPRGEFFRFFQDLAPGDSPLPATILDSIQGTRPGQEASRPTVPATPSAN
jgi:membrane protease subunit HflC